MGERDKRKTDSTTILIVDDDESILFTLRIILQNEGHQVITASEGVAALHSARTKVPDLIILDWEMPGMNGCEICRQLKSDPATAAIPVIFFTSHNAPTEKVTAFEAGAVDYLVKPYSRLELLVRLRTHLALQQRQNSLTAEVKKRTVELEEKNRELQETNLVLKRLLHEFEEEKQAVGRIVQANIEQLILPSLTRITEVSSQQRRQLRDTLVSNLKNISLPVTGKGVEVYSLLTPTELRLLSCIRQGQTSKEIAESLHISLQTVATHRKNIRKKLNISGKKINLAAFIAQAE
ncbi:response regulator [Desulfobulbus sp. TB]|nr:response regulator [Desulfobulbus sp. TB]